MYCWSYSDSVIVMKDIVSDMGVRVGDQEIDSLGRLDGVFRVY